MLDHEQQIGCFCCLILAEFWHEAEGPESVVSDKQRLNVFKLNAWSKVKFGVSVSHVEIAVLPKTWQTPVPLATIQHSIHFTSLHKPSLTALITMSDGKHVTVPLWPGLIAECFFF